ncbi:hypothetical protein LWP59_16745 [Amycolatopsis acidiphila]|uniref:Uncharacterized protein n=1 Tax=Amycolatopsis acidiphila TaxID=715473 RepID=A0A558AB61_9PSEU|nr:hypothetical protein [Amycolatopsis acidiphila]TVT21474.1 hypothetical protein FNH06_17025 [Amycolatopsis acidiphila]UIJ63155.1 hypothetical protein LWP59_16745 [Amycolatopsis acidiphila]GHG74106.1 hypothetical protein GCM10017788_37700 [Amycolatopsis acidiphila]
MEATTDVIGVLRQVIEVCPIPGAPPRLFRRGSTAGLAFLEAALRLGHVRRLTEKLDISEYRNTKRTTEVDVSLQFLNSGQRQALETLQASNPISDSDSASSTLWLPIARIPSRNPIPIEVRNASGARLPTMTQYETSWLLASGLYQLFRGILCGHQEAEDPSTELSAFLYRVHESRWIIQQAILTMLTERNRPHSGSRPSLTQHTVKGVNQHYREMAIHILDEYGPALRDYLHLLRVAMDDYFLVVGLDQSTNEHILSYTSPLRRTERPPLAKELVRRIRSARRGYYVSYSSTVPGNLNSYHLVAETTDGLDIETIFLRADSDRELSEAISADLRTLAGQMRQFSSDAPKAHRKILELETQNVLRRLNGLWCRRRWDAVHADHDQLGETMPACRDLAHAAISGEAVLDGRQQGQPDNSILRHPLVAPDILDRAAREIHDFELQADLSFESDPLGKQAHAYWRRPTGRPPNSDQVGIRASILVVDATTSGPRTVRSYALAVSAITYVVASLLGRFPFPFGLADHSLEGQGSADALVAVLLLIPGFLYSRLSLPARRSIAGYMQVLPRFVSHGSIFLVAALAAAIAAGAPNSVLCVFFALAIVVPALSILVLRDPPAERAAADGIAELGGPKWVSGPGKHLGRRDRAPDEILTSSGGRDG